MRCLGSTAARARGSCAHGVAYGRSTSGAQLPRLSRGRRLGWGLLRWPGADGAESPGRGLRGARDQGAGGRATRRWKSMGSDGVRSPELTTHGRAPGCASTAVAAVCFRAHNLVAVLEPDEVAFRSAAGAAEREVGGRLRPRPTAATPEPEDLASCRSQRRWPGFSRWAACGRRRRPRRTASSPRNASPCASDAVQP